jgi:hypothetical protein
MAMDWERMMAEELPAITAHFDAQLKAIQSLVEAAQSRQDANYHALSAEIARVARDVMEVKSDVKAQNGRVGKLEVEMAYMRGQKSGGGAMYNALMVGIGTLLGALGAMVTLLQMGGLR